MRRFITLLPVAGLLALLIGCSSNKSSPTANQIDQPSGLHATLPSPTSVSLTWTDNSDNEDGFKIRRASDGQNNWIERASVGVNVAAYTDTGLTEATRYSYAVVAFKGASLSTASDTASVTTIMMEPEELSATAISATSISLTWLDRSSVETGYRVERKLGAGRFAQVATLPANSVAMTDTGLAANSVYSYRVAAIKDAVLSDWSNESGATTRFPTPSAPSGLTIETLGISSLRLTWVDNSNNEQGFKIERSPLGEESWSLRAPVGANAVTYTDVGLTEGSSFRYRVYAFLESEISEIEGPVEGTTLPAAPTELTAARETPTSVILHWNDISATETAYSIERKVFGGDYEAAGSIAANSQSFNDAGLAQNTTYIYRVRAVKGVLNSAWSNETSIQTSLLTPNPPTDFFARGGVAYPNGANLTWTDMADNEVGFVIEASASRNTGWAVADTVEANQSSVVVSGFPSESVRFFRMYAFNAYGQSTYSSIMNANIAGIPPAPTNCAAQSTAQTPRGASITWRDNSASEDGFVLEYSPNGADGWAVMDTVVVDAAGTRVNNLTVEAPAYFRVFSFNACGRSAYSNVATTIINGSPLDPTDLIGSAPTYYAVELAWQDHSTAEQRYEIQRKDEGSNTWRINGTVPADSTSYNDSSVSAARTYHYQVRAVNGYGYSGYTNEVVVTTPMRPPTAPAELTHTEVNIDRIQLVWTDRSNNEDGFFVERRAPGDADWSLAGVNEPNNSYYLDTLLTPENWYAYRVRSHNEAGYSNWSNVDSAQTLSLTIYSETFEGMNLDAPPTGWTMNEGGTSSSRVTNTRPHNGQKSYEVQDPDTGAANFSLSYNAHESILKGTLVGWLYLTPNGFFRFAGGTSGLNYSCVIDFLPNDSFRVKDGGADVVCGTYPTNRWFKVEIVFDVEARTWHAEFDDEAVSAEVAIWTPNEPEGYIVTLAPTDGAIENVWIDDLQVLRYYDPPERTRAFLGVRSNHPNVQLSPKIDQHAPIDFGPIR